MDKQAETQLTFSGGNPGYAVGDRITYHRWRPWYLRLWRWVTRQKEPEMVVMECVASTMTVRPAGRAPK